MKMIDLRSKSDEDLKAELVNLKDQMFRLRFQKATAQLENHKQIPITKRNIARVLTEIKERELKK